VTDSSLVAASIILVGAHARRPECRDHCREADAAAS